MPDARRIADRIGREGEPVVLRRASVADLDLKGVVRFYRADELTGAIQQGDRVVTASGREIAAAAWPGPPRRGDQVVIRGRTTAVQSCETRTLRGVDAMHIIQVRG